jgi:hypothetical protein
VVRNLGLPEIALREGVRRAVIEAGEGSPGGLNQAEIEELVRLKHITDVSANGGKFVFCKRKGKEKRKREALLR